MSDTRPVGIFDSGVGGLSVLKEITSLLPNESTVFFADQKNIPYGTKNKKNIDKLTSSVTKFLISKNVKAIVVACNTATCYSIEHLRKNFKLPIIGVVPAIKPAVKITHKNKIAILATPATIKSTYLEQLINKFANEKKVFKISCLGLEEAIEKNNKQDIEALLTKYTEKIKKLEADVCVLGCTHYPLIRDQILKKLPSNYKVIDSSSSIAKRLKNILEKNNMLSDKQSKKLFYTSADPYMFSNIASYYLNTNIQAKKGL